MAEIQNEIPAYAGMTASEIGRQKSKSRIINL